MGMPADAGPQHAELLARGAVSGARHRHVLFQLEGVRPLRAPRIRREPRMR
jgi:hypothetical protein